MASSFGQGHQDALVNRLTENGRFTVLLLETFGRNLNFWIWIPIGYGKTFVRSSVNWMYQTAPNPELNDRVSYWPRGKVLGGSSSIIAMVYVRGQPQDFEAWQIWAIPVGAGRTSCRISGNPRPMIWAATAIAGRKADAAVRRAPACVGGFTDP